MLAAPKGRRELGRKSEILLSLDAETFSLNLRRLNGRGGCLAPVEFSKASHVSGQRAPMPRIRRRSFLGTLCLATWALGLLASAKIACA